MHGFTKGIQVMHGKALAHAHCYLPCPPNKWAGPDTWQILSLLFVLCSMEKDIAKALTGAVNKVISQLKNASSPASSGGEEAESITVSQPSLSSRKKRSASLSYRLLHEWLVIIPGKGEKRA